MSAPLEMTEHISDSELAAVVEHGIGRADRHVVEHLAGCDECKEALMMASDVQQELSEGGEVVRPEFGGGRRWWKVVASAAVLAGALYLVMNYSRWMKPEGTEALAEASRSVKLRTTDGRLSGFPYQERRVTRSGNPEDDIDFGRFKVEEAVAKILKEPDADPHAAAVAYMLSARPGETSYADVTPYFEKALAQAKPEERRAVVNDYAVALIKRGSDAELAQALALLEEEWRKEQTPEIGFNRALVLQHQQRDKEALAAWDDYLRLDSDSPWAGEARKNKKLLELYP